MRLLKQLIGVFAVLAVLGGLLMLFSFDIFKIQWVSFMGIQPSYGSMENPLPVPAKSIPVEGPAYIPGLGSPVNPVPADEVSVTRGAEIFALNCKMCHGDGTGNGTVAGFLVKKKPADLTSALIQNKDDGTLFLSISNGIFNPDNSLFPDVHFSGTMPPMNENLTVRDRWDVINFIRTLKAAQ
jgi:mono/diheme cytochrome c family protein